MPIITINGQIIEFPDSAQSPNWAPPVIEFAQATEDALRALINSFDVPPQVLTLDSSHQSMSSFEDLTLLSFPSSDVRAAFIRYTIYRETNSGSSSTYEAGNIVVVYNPNNSINQKWELSRQAVGDASTEIQITDDGQVQFKMSNFAGTNHSGHFTYTAQTLLNL